MVVMQMHYLTPKDDGREFSCRMHSQLGFYRMSMCLSSSQVNHQSGWQARPFYSKRRRQRKIALDRNSIHPYGDVSFRQRHLTQIWFYHSIRQQPTGCHVLPTTHPRDRPASEANVSCELLACCLPMIIILDIESMSPGCCCCCRWKLCLFAHYIPRYKIPTSCKAAAAAELKCNWASHCGMLARYNCRLYWWSNSLCSCTHSTRIVESAGQGNSSPP